MDKVLVMDKELFCRECGEEMFITDDGITHHTSDETPDGIDHNADADHVAIIG